MELTPVRVYLMYTVPAAALLLTFLLLFPEMLVKNRFLPAVCKVTHKMPYNFLKNEARIVNEVTVFDSQGRQTDVFGANACDPIDCTEGGGGFMDKEEWLDMYEEDKEYPCLYDPFRDRGGYPWVVYSPLQPKWFTWGILFLTIIVLCGVFVFHMRMKYLAGDFSKDALKEKCGSCVGCLSCCAGWCQDRTNGVTSWWRRRSGYTVQDDYELEDCEVFTEPPSYEAAREPPPSYHIVVQPGDSADDSDMPSTQRSRPFLSPYAPP